MANSKPKATSNKRNRGSSRLAKDSSESESDDLFVNQEHGVHSAQMPAISEEEDGWDDGSDTTLVDTPQSTAKAVPPPSTESTLERLRNEIGREKLARLPDVTVATFVRERHAGFDTGYRPDRLLIGTYPATHKEKAGAEVWVLLKSTKSKERSATFKVELRGPGSSNDTYDLIKVNKDAKANELEYAPQFRGVGNSDWLKVMVKYYFLLRAEQLPMPGFTTNTFPFNTTFLHYVERSADKAGVTDRSSTAASISSYESSTSLDSGDGDDLESDSEMDTSDEAVILPTLGIGQGRNASRTTRSPGPRRGTDVMRTFATPTSATAHRSRPKRTADIIESEMRGRIAKAKKQNRRDFRRVEKTDRGIKLILSHAHKMQKRNTEERMECMKGRQAIALMQGYFEEFQQKRAEEEEIKRTQGK